MRVMFPCVHMQAHRAYLCLQPVHQLGLRVVALGQHAVLFAQALVELHLHVPCHAMPCVHLVTRLAVDRRSSHISTCMLARCTVPQRPTRQWSRPDQASEEHKDDTACLKNNSALSCPALPWYCSGTALVLLLPAPPPPPHTRPTPTRTCCASPRASSSFSSVRSSMCCCNAANCPREEAGGGRPASGGGAPDKLRGGAGQAACHDGRQRLEPARPWRPLGHRRPSFGVQLARHAHVGAGACIKSCPEGGTGLKLVP